MPYKSATLLPMPSTKPTQDREEKRAELIGAARRLFVEDGYEATSMASLARAAGVAPNTIYWYFADKDAVLIAVLDAVLGDALTEYASVAQSPPADQLVWVIDQLQQVRRLVGTVHARIDRSPALDAWHTAFHAGAEDLLRTVLGPRDDPAALEADVTIAVLASEGLLSHSLPREQCRMICERLTAGE
jgi:TetR/AcrR family transcriptional regulator, cholesterol catabolism regulator